MRGVVTGAVLAMVMSGSVLAQTGAPPAAPATTWADAITLKGDLRYREEVIYDKSKTRVRERQRLRARLTAEAKCNANLKAAVGLSTGQADPVSGNQTLTDGASKKDMRLDLAFFDYSVFGENPNEVHLLGGKMNNPLITFPDDLLWDPDLRPEGLAVRSQLGRGSVAVFLNGAYQWLQERDGLGDVTLSAGQAAVRVRFRPEVVLTLGGSSCGYQNLRGLDVIDWEASNKEYGNSTVAGSAAGKKAYASHFHPSAFHAQADLWIARTPIGLFVQTVTNEGADRLNDGRMFGITVGKAKNPKTWEFNYSYAKLRKDAVPGMFTDSDRWGGGTDGKGSKFAFKYQIMKNFQAGATYFLDRKRISDPKKTKDYGRLQIDVLASF